jgi:hypothetical protein
VRISQIRRDSVLVGRDGRPTAEGVMLIDAVNELIRRFGGTDGASTVAALGDAIAPAMKLCTNETGGAVMVFADGAGDWRRVTDRVVAS